MAYAPLIITMPDSSEIEVQPTLEDTLAFELFLRKNRRHGELKDNALKLQPFRAFNAARRQGKLPEGYTWEQFTTGDTAALDVTIKSDTDDDGDDVAPAEGVEEVEGVGEAGRTDQYTV